MFLLLLPVAILAGCAAPTEQIDPPPAVRHDTTPPSITEGMSEKDMVAAMRAHGFGPSSAIVNGSVIQTVWSNPYQKAAYRRDYFFVVTSLDPEQHDNRIVIKVVHTFEGNQITSVPID
jgi:hypothetical protein